MFSLLQILLLILNVVYFVMIAHIIMSWLINFRCSTCVSRWSTRSGTG